jgi:hypothetical protein
MFKEVVIIILSAGLSNILCDTENECICLWHKQSVVIPASYLTTGLGLSAEQTT